MEELIFEVDLSSLAVKIASADPKVRIEAIDSVRDLSRKSIKAREVLSMLISALDNEPDPQIISRLTKLIGKLGDTTVTTLLKKFLWHPDARVVANTLEGLGYIYSLDIIAIVLPFLNSPDNRIKANAVKALYGLNPTMALEKLSEMVNSDEVFFRDSAAFILASILDSTCQDMLIELITKETDMEILKRSISSLCNKGDELTVEKLEKACITHKGRPQCKIFGEIIETIKQRLKTQISTIQNINKVSDLSKLIEIYNNGNNREKEQVCLRLFEVGDETSLPLLKKAANDEDNAIRYAAKKAINNIFSKASQKNQTRFTFTPPPAGAQAQSAEKSHPSAAQADKAKKSLEKAVDLSDIIGAKKSAAEPAGEKYIEEIDMAFLVLDLSNSNPAKRAEAVSKLLYANKNSIGVRDAIKYLIERLYVETEPQVKSQTLRVIGTLGSKTEIPVLKKYVEDETNDFRVRANALEGLGSIDDPEIFEMIKPYLNHNDNRIKANAIIAAWKRDPDSTFNAISEMIRSQNIAMRDSAAYGLLILKTNDKRIISLMFELFIRETVPDIILKLTQGLSILGDENILSDMEKMLPNSSALKRPHIETIIQKLRQKFDSLRNINTREAARDRSYEASDFDSQFEQYSIAHKQEVRKAADTAEERRPASGKTLTQPKYIEKDDGTRVLLRTVEAHLFEMNHPDEKVRLNAIFAIKHYLVNGLPVEHYNQVEMLLTLSLNDASLKVRKEAFEAYQLIQTHKVVILKGKKGE